MPDRPERTAAADLLRLVDPTGRDPQPARWVRSLVATRRAWLQLIHYRWLTRNLRDTNPAERNFFDGLPAPDRESTLQKPGDSPQYRDDIAQIMSLLPEAQRVLDVGCGTGWTSLRLAQAGHRVVGVDLCDQMLLAGAKRNCHPQAWYVVMDYRRPALNTTFDALLSYDALHHSSRIVDAVRACARLLRPGELIILCEPGLWHRYARTSREARRDYGVTERDLPPFVLERLLLTNGFSAVATRGRRTWESGPRRYFDLCQKWLGADAAQCLSLLRRLTKGGVVVGVRSPDVGSSIGSR